MVYWQQEAKQMEITESGTASHVERSSLVKAHEYQMFQSHLAELWGEVSSGMSEVGSSKAGKTS